MTSKLPEITVKVTVDAALEYAEKEKERLEQEITRITALMPEEAVSSYGYSHLEEEVYDYETTLSKVAQAVIVLRYKKASFPVLNISLGSYPWDYVELTGADLQLLGFPEIPPTPPAQE